MASPDSAGFLAICKKPRGRTECLHKRSRPKVEAQYGTFELTAYNKNVVFQEIIWLKRSRRLENGTNAAK